MKNSPPNPHRPPPAGTSGRVSFKLGGLLGSLIEAGYQEDAREVVELYVEDHLATFSTIDSALNCGDLEKCAQAAHTLIGSAGGIGAMELATALTALEAACRKGDMDVVESVLPTVESEKERVLFTAKEFLNKGPAAS